MNILELPRIMIDFETFSILDVTDCGAWAYGEHPSTEILCMGYKIGKAKARLWTPDLPFPQEIIDHVNAGYVIEAHNVAFERAIWYHILHVQMGIPLPTRWVDTMASCAYRGLPMALDKVGKVLNLPIQKDKRGKYLITKLCSPQKPTKKNPDTRNRDWDLLQELYDYCVRDVEAEYALLEAIGDLPYGEYKVWVLDQTINHRGVMIDAEAVYGAQKIIDTVFTALVAELKEITDNKVQSGSEIEKIKDWLANQGYPLPNLQANTIEAELKQKYLSDKARRVLEIRQQLSLASIKKIGKFVETLNRDNRIRGILQYHGAATGRWAGRLVQPQNFPRKTAKNIEEIIEAIKTGDAEYIDAVYGEPLAVISSALRGMFLATPGTELFVADFSAIEARVVMWVAGQENALEAFHKYDRKEGPDIYCVMAESIYGRPIDAKVDKAERQLGKIGVLGCGYQMGAARLQEQAANDYKTIISFEMAEKIVNTYRETYSEVKDLWRYLEDAAVTCVKHKKRTRYKKIGFEYITDNAGEWLTMILPNGRRLWYYKPELYEAVIPYKDKKTGEMKKWVKDSLTYEGRDNKMGGVWTRISTYGGMLTENAVQAIARDLMVEAMGRSERAGYKIVMTIHDEVVAERPIGEGDIKEFEHIIAGPNPKWAEGCPVAAEGWHGTRYKKG